MIAVIMAGGKGTRLSEVTGGKIPKPMVKLDGKPILEHQIDTLKENEIYDIIIVGGYLFEQIKEYFGDGSSKGVRISYLWEETPLGTAGALCYLRETIREDFLLILGDLLFDMDISRLYEFHKSKRAGATLVVHPNSHPYDSDLLITDEDGQITDVLLKSQPHGEYCHNIVNAGIYMLSSEIWRQCIAPRKMDLEKDVLFRGDLKQKRLYAYRTTEYIRDVGTPERLSEAEKSLKKGIVTCKNLRNSQPCIFLDRDGTLNEYVGLLCKPEQLKLEEHVIEAIREINQSRYLAIVITNQPVVAKGMCTIEEVEKIHGKLETLLGEHGVYVDDIYYCPHHPDKGFPEENPKFKIKCNCRKPGTGLIDVSEEKYHIDRSASWIIGDTTVDIQTGHNAGIGTILLSTGEAGKDEKYSIKPHYVCSDLFEAVRLILESDEDIK